MNLTVCDYKTTIKIGIDGATQNSTSPFVLAEYVYLHSSKVVMLLTVSTIGSVCGCVHSLSSKDHAIKYNSPLFEIKKKALRIIF